MANSPECSSHPSTPIIPLHPSEERLILYMRALGHGWLEIKVVSGYPVMIEQGIKQVKLT